MTSSFLRFIHGSRCLDADPFSREHRAHRQVVTESGIAAIKSVYKSFKGTKGVNRRKNAEVLIDGANAGNVEPLHLLYTGAL